MLDSKSFSGVIFDAANNKFIESINTVTFDKENTSELECTLEDKFDKHLAMFKEKNPTFSRIQFTVTFGRLTDIFVHSNIQVVTYGEYVYTSMAQITVFGEESGLSHTVGCSGDLRTLLSSLNVILKAKSLDKYVALQKRRSILDFKHRMTFEVNQAEGTQRQLQYTIDRLELDILEMECMVTL
ncbi:MAG: hypothetical protein KAH32_00010 [Chlamydiia bacterium]|nr:hypothetical protein [Chlamydiia bacterium]